MSSCESGEREIPRSQQRRLRFLRQAQQWMQFLLGAPDMLRDRLGIETKPDNFEPIFSGKGLTIVVRERLGISMTDAQSIALGAGAMVVGFQIVGPAAYKLRSCGVEPVWSIDDDLELSISVFAIDIINAQEKIERSRQEVIFEARATIQEFRELVARQNASKRSVRVFSFHGEVMIDGQRLPTVRGQPVVVVDLGLSQTSRTMRWGSKAAMLQALFEWFVGKINEIPDQP